MLTGSRGHDRSCCICVNIYSKRQSYHDLPRSAILTENMHMNVLVWSRNTEVVSRRNEILAERVRVTYLDMLQHISIISTTPMGLLFCHYVVQQTLRRELPDHDRRLQILPEESPPSTAERSSPSRCHFYVSHTALTLTILCWNEAIANLGVPICRLRSS